MKIIVKSQIGIPVNPHEKYLYGSGELSQTWAYFERSIATHPAPGLADGEYESDLVWQHYSIGHSEWYLCDETYDHLLAEYCGEKTRQIWVVSPSLKEEGVKQDGIDEFELNDMQIRFDNKKGLLYITQGDDEILLTEREWLKLKELLSILSL